MPHDLSVNWRDMVLANGITNLKGSDERLIVQVETSDEWCPQGSVLNKRFLTSLSVI